MDEKKKHLDKKYTITEKGSLGVLALGDIGLREWRKVKNANRKKDINEEE
jgi:hypothetical protein